jgi:hypothetical protein
LEWAEPVFEFGPRIDDKEPRIFAHHLLSSSALIIAREGPQEKVTMRIKWRETIYIRMVF